MGIKAAVIGFAPESPRAALRAGLVAGPEARPLAEQFAGDGPLTYLGAAPLHEALWPEEGTVCAGRFDGLDIVAFRDLARSRPSEISEAVLDVAAGRRAYAVFLHSVVDWAAFAVWDGERLVRSLSLSPGEGVVEDIGGRMPFERPYWAGAHALDHAPDYPLPFHPLELGDEALAAHFGFALEGALDDDILDPEDVSLAVFRTA
ncbi:DUF6928 family protein [Streptomyces avicenniae]|uniref:DUF6928 family protein n=1 Tax=Streptomyces avicenniae TaxID=500153 RepID=UPI00069BC445|nr:hypothetical protein [Streptomyces avicenniae]